MSIVEEKRKKKKKHIIEALKNCLAVSVYSQVSLEDIAAESGLSKGGLRHYFPTREELYMELIEDFFNQIQKDHIDAIKGLGSDGEDKAFISTLFGIERFLYNEKNIKIFINLILFGFEEPKIMSPIRRFIRNHLELYVEIINDSRKNSPAVNDDAIYIGRITQIVMLCAGIFESIDPVSMDTPKLIEYTLKLFKMSTDKE